MAEKKVLIIDDEPELVQLLTLRFESEGYQVISAGDGVQGLDKAQKEKPDLILLDILMPRMDGYQVLQKLREQEGKTKDIPVLIISARGRMRDLFNDWEISGFLEKPFEANELLSKVGELLDQAKKESSKKALIIGKDKEALSLIKVFLESHGFQTQATASGSTQAIEQAIKMQPDLIFAQAIMEGMNGTEICRILREEPRTKQIPFIIFNPRNLGIILGSISKVTKVIDYFDNSELIRKIGEFVKQYTKTTE